mmetsp:Transcript_13778/g.32158  ORF Transcript_13778/g.32158 Transcript_13778/m.32158 type:complete len:262 (-) Transcript_13778:8-793(-)
MASEANCPAVSMTIRGSTVSVVRKCITSSSSSSLSSSLLFLTFTGFLMLWVARALRASTMALMVVGWMEGRIPLSSRSGSPIRFFVPDSPEVLPPVSLEAAIRSEMSMLPKSCGSLSLSLSSPSEKIVSRAADKATFFVVEIVVVVVVVVVVVPRRAVEVEARLGANADPWKLRGLRKAKAAPETERTRCGRDREAVDADAAAAEEQFNTREDEFRNSRCAAAENDIVRNEKLIFMAKGNGGAKKRAKQHNTTMTTRTMNK